MQPPLPVINTGRVRMQPGMVTVPITVNSSIAASIRNVMTLNKPGGQNVVVTTQNLGSAQPAIPRNVQILYTRPGTPAVAAQKSVSTVSSRVVIGTPQVVATRATAPIMLQTRQNLQPGQQGRLLLKTENGQYQLLSVGPAPAASTLRAPQAQTLRLSSVPAIMLQTRQNLQPGQQGRLLLKTENGQYQLLSVGPAPAASTLRAPQAQTLRLSSVPAIMLQTRQNLQPGQQGRLLLKTENGQYQLLSVGPAPAASTLRAPQAQTLRLSSVPAIMLQTRQNLQPGQQGRLLLKTENGQYQLLSVGPAPAASTLRAPQAQTLRLSSVPAKPTQPKSGNGVVLQNIPIHAATNINVNKVCSGEAKAMTTNNEANFHRSNASSGLSTVLTPGKSLVKENEKKPTQPKPGKTIAVLQNIPIHIEKKITVSKVSSGGAKAMTVNNEANFHRSNASSGLSTVLTSGKTLLKENEKKPTQPKSGNGVVLQNIPIHAATNINVNKVCSGEAKAMTTNNEANFHRSNASSGLSTVLTPGKSLVKENEKKPTQPKPGKTIAVLQNIPIHIEKKITVSKVSSGGAKAMTVNNEANFHRSNASSGLSTVLTSGKSLVKKNEKKASFSQRFGDDEMAGDDDVNDVVAMGGVNLAEETQRILGSTEMIGTQIRSCKDEYLVPLGLMQARIKSIVAKHNMDEPPPEVAILLTLALQERLKSLIEKLAVIAKHRIDHELKTDNRYEPTQDVKGQLKFLEELDRVDKKRREDSEREMLLRAAKSRSKNEDSEQAKLKAKAKEMLRAELEELRLRRTNSTALQAIGPRKKPRLEGPGAAGDSVSSSAGHSGTGYNDRVIRINLRDMIFLLEQERDTAHSLLLYKCYLK